MHLRELLETYSEDDLKSWLVAGFQNKEWEPVVFEVQPTIPAQIQRVFGDLRARDQDKLRRAVTRAIGEWTPEHPRVLARVCELAAYTRPTRAVPLLRDLVMNTLVEYEHEPEYRKLTSIVIGTITGLVPVPEAVDAIEILYFSDHVPPRYAAQLLQGMISAVPLEFPRYLPRFVTIAARHEDLFRLDVILETIIEDISPAKFSDHYERLDKQTRDLLNFLMPKNGIVYDAPTRRLTTDLPVEDAVIAANEARIRRDRAAQQDLATYFGLVEEVVQ
jgi:hypothetical protein